MRMLVLGRVLECPCVSPSVLSARMQEQRTTVGSSVDESSKHGQVQAQERSTEYVLQIRARLTVKEHEVLD